MIRYAIVDDEPISHRIIEGFADKIKELQKVGNCYDAFEAISLIQREEVNLLFLDLNMPKLSGFEFLKTIDHPPKVIVISAYEEYALEGYEFDVIDYLLKPFSLERFTRAVNKVLLKETVSHSTSTESGTSHIFIKSNNKQIRVRLDEILYIEASRNYCKVFLKKEMIKTLRKISEFEEILPKPFIRIHNSFIIAADKVDAIDGNRIHIHTHVIPVGQTYKSVLAKIYNF